MTYPSINTVLYTVVLSGRSRKFQVSISMIDAMTAR
nr:MAG TPA: hypothetical protein [Caudoviricetes sp.]